MSSSTRDGGGIGLRTFRITPPDFFLMGFLFTASQNRRERFLSRRCHPEESGALLKDLVAPLSEVAPSTRTISVAAIRSRALEY
jgi:hypothetical protein